MQGKTIYSAEDEVIVVRNNWQAEAEKLGTTVSSSAWEWTGSGSTASAATSGYAASVTLTPTSDGTLRNTLTFASGDVRVLERKVVLR